MNLAVKSTTVIEGWKHKLQRVLIDYGEEPDEVQLSKVLEDLGTKGFPHAHGKTLYIHLLGTWKILNAWNQPYWIQAAGLFHSIYSSDVYKRKVLDSGKDRAKVRGLIGTKAERLVYLFCHTPRQIFFNKLMESESVITKGMTVSTTLSDSMTDLSLDSSEVCGLAIIHMANEAEQTCLNDRSPGIWLSKISTLAQQIKKAKENVPDLFSNAIGILSSENELTLRDCYMSGLEKLSSDPNEAETDFIRCSEICDTVAEPFILRAYIAALKGNEIDALELGSNALRLLDQWGASWDKRLRWSEWKDLASVFQNQTRFESKNRIPAEFINNPRVLFSRFVETNQDLIVDKINSKAEIQVQDDHGSKTLLPKRMERYIASFASQSRHPLMLVYPELPSQPWHEPHGFPIVQSLEDSYEVIRDEIMKLSDEDFQSESEKIARKGNWDVFFFYERGKKNEENCARCPTIASIIDSNETVKTLAGLMYVSRMRPDTYIAPHRGPTNMRLRCHLGIQIPNGDCGLRVGNDVGTWKQGQCVVFDDFYEHEAWNRTLEDRIVLIIDLWHPALSVLEREIIKGIHLFAFTQARSLSSYWNKNQAAKNLLSEYH